MVILGIDPGTARAGYGILEINKQKYTLVDCDLLSKDAKTHTVRLFEIRKRLVQILKKYNPDKAVVETLFFTKNKKTGLLVAEARGVIIQTLVEFNIPIIELTPNQIKLAVTGNGESSKAGIKKMLSLLLKTDFIKTVDDVTDAIAAAFAGSQNSLQ